MTDKSAVSLRPALAEDRFRIRRWLADPEVEAWWGNAASAEAEINMAMSSAAALCRIVESEGAPVGYAHAAGDRAVGRGSARRAGARHLAHQLFPQPPADSIAAPASDRPSLALLAEEVFATTLAVACSGVVSIRNEAAARAYERAGFRWQQIWSDRLLGPSWLMLKERPT